MVSAWESTISSRRIKIEMACFCAKHKVRLDLGTWTDFTVGCIFNSFDLSSDLEPGFFEGEIKGINYTTDNELGSSTYV